MAMHRLGRRPGATLVWHGTTAALIPAAPSGEVVVSLHGWPNGGTALATLDALIRDQRTGTGYPLDAMLATGHVIVFPWLGASWGTVASSEQASTDVSALLDTLGLDIAHIHLIGGSMGAFNAITFAGLGDPSWPVVLYVPLVSIGDAWDLGGAIRTSIESVWGVGRATVVAAAADVDPVQIDCSALTGRTTVIAATNDPLISHATVAAWCELWDLPLITTTSGHFSLDDPAVNELDLLATFT